jgi:hypothetical protein
MRKRFASCSAFCFFSSALLLGVGRPLSNLAERLSSASVASGLPFLTGSLLAASLLLVAAGAFFWLVLSVVVVVVESSEDLTASVEVESPAAFQWTSPLALRALQRVIFYRSWYSSLWKKTHVFGWVWGMCCEFCARVSTCRDPRRRLVGEAGLQIRCCQRPIHRSSRPSSWLRWHRRR